MIRPVISTCILFATVLFVFRSLRLPTEPNAPSRWAFPSRAANSDSAPTKPAERTARTFKPTAPRPAGKPTVRTRPTTEDRRAAWQPPRPLDLPAGLEPARLTAPIDLPAYSARTEQGTIRLVSDDQPLEIAVSLEFAATDLRVQPQPQQWSSSLLNASPILPLPPSMRDPTVTPTPAALLGELTGAGGMQTIPWARGPMVVGETTRTNLVPELTARGRVASTSPDASAQAPPPFDELVTDADTDANTDTDAVTGTGTTSSLAARSQAALPPNASATLVFRDELPTAERPDPEDPTPDDSPTDRAPQAPPAAVARHTTRSLTLHESPPPARKLSPQLLFLGQRIEQCLQFYADKPLNTLDDSAWSIMHSFLGYGIEGQVAANGPRGPRTNAVSWLCANKPFAGGYRLFYLENGELRAREGPGFQGHPAQFLAMLAQTRVSSKTPIQCEGRQFTVHDLVEVEKATCTSKTEMTFKLIGLSHYLNSDEEWTSRSRETWSIPKLLSIEMASPVNGVACGGTHRLMACSYALSIREQRGEPMDGPYTKAQKYIRDYQRYTMTLQNPDGSFSSDWFRRRTNWGDVNRKIQTTGHMLEWLVFSLPEADLYSVQLIKSVNFLTNLMIENRYQDWEVGPRGHALRALSLYHERVFEDQRAIADRTQANPR